MPQFSRTSILVFLLLLLTCAVYSPVVKQQFVDWDDTRHVLAVWKPGFERAWNIVTDLKLKSTGTAYYSPIFFLSLMSDQLAALGGNHPEPGPAKAMNVVYHLLNVLLVLKLLLMSGVGRRAAFVGAALFAIHPLQVGTVAWISERKNLLSTLFYLSGVTVFIGYYKTGRKKPTVVGFESTVTNRTTPPRPSQRESEKDPSPQPSPKGRGSRHPLAPAPGERVRVRERVRGGLVGTTDQVNRSRASTIRGRVYEIRYLVLLPILFVAGILSKPSVVTLPVALAAWIILVPHEKRSERISYLLIALLLVLAMGWGAFVVSTEVSYPGILPPWYYRPLLASGAIWFYVGKIVCPLNLAPIYPRWEVQEHLPVFLGLFAGLLAAAGLIARYHKFIKPGSLWGLFFFLLNLLPVIGLVPFGYMGHSYVSDHFVYLSMVGVAFIVSHESERLFSKTRDRAVLSSLVLGLFLACIGMLSVLAYRQTGIWHDGDTLWSYALKVNDKAVAAYNNYGRFQMMKRKPEKALELFRKASEIAPGFEAPYNNMGDAYRSLGDDEQAVKMYNKAIALNEKAIYPRIMKAGMMKQRGKPEEAIVYLEKCVKRFPRSADFHNELGVAYSQAGRNEEALQEFDKAIASSPTFTSPAIHKATLLLNRGDKDQAVALLERAVSLASVRPEALNVLGAAYAAQGKHDLALKAFLKAHGLKPDLPAVCDNVANAYMDLGDYRAADDFCVRAARSGTPCRKETWTRLETEASRQ